MDCLQKGEEAIMKYSVQAFALTLILFTAPAVAQRDLPEYLQPIHGTANLSAGFSSDGPLEVEIPFAGNEPMEDRLRQYDGDIWKCGGDTTIPPAMHLLVDSSTTALHFRVYEDKSFVGDVTFGLLKPDGSVVCDKGGNYNEPLLLSIEAPMPGSYFIWLGNGLFSDDDSIVSVAINETSLE